MCRKTLGSCNTIHGSCSSTLGIRNRTEMFCSKLFAGNFASALAGSGFRYHSGPEMGSFGMDLRAAVRGLLHHRSVTVLAVACLALGVGTSAAMLGLLDALLYRPPAHVVEPGAVRRVYFLDTIPGIGEFTAPSTPYPVFRDLEKVRSFSAVGGFFPTESSLGRGAEARKVRLVAVTPGFLRLLEVRPALGHLFSDSEGAPV